MDIKDSFLRILYPRRCVICDNIISYECNYFICPDCEGKNEWIKGKVCDKCGKPIDYMGLCKTCRNSKYFFDKAYALYVYKDEIRESIHRMKYSKRGSYTRYYGMDMAEFADKHNLPHVDYVTCVPVHRSRYVKRGYNQSYLLAEAYCKHRGEQYKLLVLRKRKTKTQSSLNKEQRKVNIKGVFSFNTECGVDIKGKSVLIIDDIYTTGSTINEIARVLKNAGAKTVYALCLSIVDVD